MVEVKEKNLPGAALRYGGKGEKGFDQFQMLISATKGLSLSQVCAVTGLEATTIQNWVKRGWVAHPSGKKYAEVHIARILIINALKECLRLEHIALLIAYVKGAQENVGAGSIKESDLYSALCKALFDLENGIDAEGGVEAIAERVAFDLENYTPKAKKRIQKALTVMVYACVCADVKRRTETMMSQVLKEHGVMAPTFVKSTDKKQPKAERITPVQRESAPPAQKPQQPERPVYPERPVHPVHPERHERSERPRPSEQSVTSRKTVSQALREWDARALENTKKAQVDAGKAFIDVINSQSFSENQDLLSGRTGLAPERAETPPVRPIYFNKE